MIPPELTEDNDEQHSHDWENAVAEVWAEEWSDPRDDIYLAEDGSPIC
jgi:hypothetical protein